ncbi:MAG: hypothetical protein HY954_07445 [Deltaproteobacteria bacterium]|nr:hypothetical protein [Deltaproteobacteria bacterium]
MPDTKIPLSKPCVNEEAAKGEPGLKVQKTGNRPVSDVSAGNADILRLGVADVVTLSKELKSVLKYLSSSETPPPTQPAISQDSLKTLISALLKERILKGEAGLVALLNKLESEEIDAVTLFKDLKSILKSVSPQEASAPRQIDLPQAAGAPFLMTLLNEILPGLRLRFLKLYWRKSRAGFRKKKDDDEQRQEPSEKDGEDDDSCYLLGKRYSNPEPVKLTSSGIIRTAGGHCLRFRLVLNLASETGGALCGKGFELDPLIANYAGSIDELKDFRFAFDLDHAIDGKNPPFAGRRVGLLIINLARIGTASDGSMIFGLPDVAASAESAPEAAQNGLWIEEKIENV